MCLGPYSRHMRPPADRSALTRMPRHAILPYEVFNNCFALTASAVTDLAAVFALMGTRQLQQSQKQRREQTENRLRGAGVDCLHPELPVQFSCFQLSARAPCRCAPDALLKAITSHISHKPPRRFAPCRLDADDILSRSSWANTTAVTCFHGCVRRHTHLLSAWSC